MEKLRVQAKFVKDSQKRLILSYDLYLDNKKLSLSLSEMMQFMYEHEAKLSESVSTFLYFVSKTTKKFSFQHSLIYGIMNEADILQFFLKGSKHKIQIIIHENKKTYPLSTRDELPISIILEQTAYKLHCKIMNKSYLKKHPTHFLILKESPNTYLYCSGIIRKIDKRIEAFLTKCLRQSTVIFDTTETISSFLQRIYTPNKRLFRWEILGNLNKLLPNESPPVPILKLHYDGHCLHPNISYKYGNEIIGPDYSDNLIIDKKSGKKHKRMANMEGIFQQDIMTLFETENLPFLLSNPGDIAKFFDHIVPELKTRNWEVESNVDDFNVIDEPVNLTFEIENSGKDWFHFEPNCNIMGETRSLMEISRLMVENQGYVKTKKGYAKISQSTQDELRLLRHSGALNPGKSFTKKEILPMMMMSKTSSKNESIQSIISNVNSFNVSETELSKAFNGTLRSYQHYGVHWMNLLSNVQLGGILADDMGLGKTVQTLAFSSMDKKQGPTLVVCPTAVLFNWQREIERFLPGKKSLIYGGPNRFNDLKQLTSYDYVIVSYGIVKNDIEYLKAIIFETILVDEAQAIKNPQAQISKAIKQLQGQFKLVMTGTPIENHIQDIWNLFDFIMPNYLGNKNHFDETIKSSNKEFLRAKIKPFVLRREKREVLDSLPEKTEIILECPLSDKQMQLYLTVLEATKKGIQVNKHKRDKLNMLTALLKLRQVCTHPDLIAEFNGLGIESAKFDMLKEKSAQLIDEGHKVVIFSQFTSMLDIIEKWVKKENINFERIDGSVSGKERMARVDRFQTSDDPTLFLISLKAGGVGINLTAADYVFHIDPWWNPAVQAQATDRVHRMGQTNKVIVYKLICSGTIEEKIHNLQEEKKQLLSEIVDIDSAAEKQIDFDEIKSLILT